MLAKSKEVDTVPFFWTMQYGKSIRYAGKPLLFSDLVIKAIHEQEWKFKGMKVIRA